MAVESRGRRSGSERDSATRARLDAFEKEKKRRKLAQLTEEQKRRRLGE